MKIIVNDTNIFIDLHSIGMLEEMCNLPYEIHTVDFVAAEIVEETQRIAFEHLVSIGKIRVNSFSAEEVMRLYPNILKYPAICLFRIALYAITPENIKCRC